MSIVDLHMWVLPFVTLDPCIGLHAGDVFEQRCAQVDEMWRQRPMDVANPEH